MEGRTSLHDVSDSLSSFFLCFRYSFDELQDMEYKRVVVKGKFDHSKELYMHPRSFIEEGDQPTSGFGVKPKSGAWVVTPFQLSDTK